VKPRTPRKACNYQRDQRGRRIKLPNMAAFIDHRQRLDRMPKMRFAYLLRCASQFLLCVALAGVLQSASAESPAPQDRAFWRTGFYWSLSARDYRPEDIPWEAYTHIFQMAIQPGARCVISQEIYKPYQAMPGLVSTAHAHARKVLITLLHDKNAKWMNICTGPGHVKAFVEKLREFLVRHDYDGIDIDWEINVAPENYQALIRELRASLPDKLITVDIAVHQRGYVSKIQDLMDRIHLMSYDLHTTDYDGRPIHAAWHNAATRRDALRRNWKSAEADIEYLAQAGIKRSKIVLGIPFYGYAIRGCSPGEAASCTLPPRLGQRLEPTSIKVTQVTYGQMVDSCLKIAEERWDPASEASYFRYSPKHLRTTDPVCAVPAFITVATPRSVTAGARLAVREGLGGVMSFALHQEFLSSQQGAPRYSLTSAISLALARSGEP
jgi:GH18 family chitinase